MSLAAVASAYLLALRVPQAIGELNPEPQPLTTQVKDSQIDYGQEASITGTYALGAPIISSGLAGTITESALVPGAVLNEGDILYRVDDRPVVAFVDDQVFYRPLTLGSQGRDVEAAQRLLNVLVPEAQIAEDGRFGTSTLRAAQSYARNHGLGARVEHFQSSWFVRLPHEDYKVVESTITIGGIAPAAGEQIASTAPRLASVSVEAASGAPDGEYILIAEGREVPVRRESAEWLVPEIHSVAEILVPNTEGLNATSEGYVRMAQPVPAQMVPAASVVAGTGRDPHCVLIADSRGYTAVGVRIAGNSSAHEVYIVEPELDRDSIVLLNPAEVAPDTECL